MSTISVWVPLFSAGAALVGGGLGAMLQGRYGVTNWRRQVRLESYINFANAMHDFNNRFYEAITSDDKVGSEERWKKVVDAERLMARIGSALMIVGPPSAYTAALQAGVAANKMIRKSLRPESRSAMVKSWNNATLDEYQKWLNASHEFGRHCRGVLRTGGTGLMVKRPDPPPGSASPPSR